MDFAPNWTLWPQDQEKPDKIYTNEDPPNEEWKRRCDLEMMTARWGVVVLDLPYSAYRNFGKFVNDLTVYHHRELKDVLTKALIGQGRSKKYGVFSTIRFEIAGFTDGNQFLETLPEPTEEKPPTGDEDFVPY